MFAIAKRIVNGMVMTWEAFLFLLKYSYIYGYGIVLVMFAIVLAYMIPQLRIVIQEEVFSVPLSAAENLFSTGGWMTLLGIYLFSCASSFMEVAVIKYILAILNRDASSTKKHDSFYYAAQQIVPIISWGVIVGSIFIAGFFIPLSWVYVLLAFVVSTAFFVPALIAEEKVSWSQIVPESLRIMRMYWPECIGFMGIPMLYWGGYALIYPAEFALKGSGKIALEIFAVIVSEPVFKAIVVQAARGKKVSEDFAPYIKSSHT